MRPPLQPRYAPAEYTVSDLRWRLADRSAACPRSARPTTARCPRTAQSLHWAVVRPGDREVFLVLGQLRAHTFDIGRGHAGRCEVAVDASPPLLHVVEDAKDSFGWASDPAAKRVP